MSNPKKPVQGDLIIDASDLNNVVDITPEEINGFVKFHDGYEKALANLERLKSEDIDRAGINPKAVQDAVALTAEHQHCEELLPAAQKLAELIYSRGGWGRERSLFAGDAMMLISSART